MNEKQLEIFSKLFFMNLSKNLNLNLNLDIDFDLFPGQHSPVSGGSGNNQLEPPTPPRTPIISGNSHSTPKSSEKQQQLYNNNNDDAKENLEENSSVRRSASNTPIKFLPNVTLTPTSKLIRNDHHGDTESDQEDYPNRHMNEDSNFSDEEMNSQMGGRHSVMNGADDSDHGSDLYTDASSFDSSKLSLKNVEGMMDKSSQMVSGIFKFYFLQNLKSIFYPISGILLAHDAHGFHAKRSIRKAANR